MTWSLFREGEIISNTEKCVSVNIWIVTWLELQLPYETYEIDSTKRYKKLHNLYQDGSGCSYKCIIVPAE